MDVKLCMYNHLETLDSLKQSRGIPNVFIMSSTSDFNNILQYLATAGVTKCVETRQCSHRMCVLIGSTYMPSLMCNRICVADLLTANDNRCLHTCCEIFS